MASPLTHLSGAISVRVASALRQCDRLKRPVNSEEQPPESTERILIAVPHWRPTGTRRDAKSSGSASLRGHHLSSCVRSLQSLTGTQLDLVIYSNAPHETQRLLEENADIASVIAHAETALQTRSSEALSVTIAPWKPGRIYRHGFGLAWSHKSLFRAALQVEQISHLVYLEDDMLFDQANLDYWVWGRQCLHGTGLIPGFVRFEKFSGESWLTDLKSSMPRPHDTVPTMDEAEWFSMPNPYQALYVMDRALAIDHFNRSPSRSRIRSRLRPHDDLASASHGPIYDDAPTPRRWRTVVPFRPEGVHPAALIEHTAANYAADPSTSLGSIRLSEVFDD